MTSEKAYNGSGFTLEGAEWWQEDQKQVGKGCGVFALEVR